MTSPEPEVPRSEPEPGPERASRHDWRDLEKNPIVGWAKAIALGVADTAKDMLEAGREGARDAMDEGWERFDRKTKHRRK
ncbi:MAG: hypothetical protein M9925_08970 [Chloroflexi bacterium]|nr:hypothetical protein [Dehalococcoidia bacterium]MCO5201814.1 hypothetical protein [Chloroflexota bacterium]MCZ7577204.1 hypothetical protein [Dehalococcoidia bacterium]PWB46729.1 MAG: hypothetical protein C3F10_03835 [Dehalococcoidia bacterium]